jgi:hypothetical protein
MRGVLIAGRPLAPLLCGGGDRSRAPRDATLNQAEGELPIQAIEPMTDAVLTEEERRLLVEALEGMGGGDHSGPGGG